MEKEIFRKSFHILFGIIFLLLIYFVGTGLSFQIITVCFLLGLIVALLHRRGIKLPLFERVIFEVEREHEKHFPGKAALLFFLSALILLYFFKSEQGIVLGALSVAIFADAGAALIGKKFGKHKIVNKKHYIKSVEGTLACFVIALVVLLFFVPIGVAIVGAIVATILELMPLNDNLSVPLATAVALKLLL
jgi:dolichol kinase